MFLYVSVGGDSGNIICSRDIRINYIGWYSTPVCVLQTLLRIFMCLSDYLACMFVPPVARAGGPSCLVALMRQQGLMLCLILSTWFRIGQIRPFRQYPGFLAFYSLGRRLVICSHHITRSVNISKDILTERRKSKRCFKLHKLSLPYRIYHTSGCVPTHITSQIYSCTRSSYVG